MSVFVGDILSATPASVSAYAGSTRTLQWLRSNTAIPSANTTTYRITEEDIDNALSILQTETNFMGSASASSDITIPIQNWNPRTTLFAANEPGVWFDPSDVANLNWRRNLLTWTEQLDNAAWVKNDSAVVAANTVTGPFIGTLADTVDLSAVSGAPTIGSRVAQTVSTTGPVTFSFWARSISGTGTFPAAYFDVSLGWVKTFVTLSEVWTRYTIPITASSNAVGFSRRGQTHTETLFSAYIWGAQLELGTIATEYQRITDVNTEVRERFPTATLYQDAAGTTPVTAPAQPVGLALDKSQGLVLGPELVTNGDFSVDASWTKGTGWTIAGGVASFSNPSGAVLSQSGYSILAGQTVEVSFDVVSGSATIDVFISGGGGSNGTGARVFAAGVRHAVRLQASINRTTVSFSAVGGSNFSIDNISVRELPGFHATQATAASRPTYGVVPSRGRVNLLERTEEFENAYWTKQETTVVQNAAAAPDGTLTADRLVPTAVSSTHQVNRLSLVTSQACTISFYLKPSGYNTVEVLDGTSATNGAIFDASSGTVTNKGTGVGSITSLPDGWYRCTLLVTTTGVRFYVPTSLSNFTGNGTSGILIWGAQLELGSTASPYQRVGSQFDVTDPAGFPSYPCHYLQFDGVDDFMQTPTITPNADKVQVFAGVRKLSDAATGTIVELSTTSQTGTFFLTESDADYGFRSRGTTSGTATANVTSPITSVVTGIGDIAGDIARIRVNGAGEVTSTADQGTGNFLAYPLFIGRRGGTVNPFNGQLFGLIVRFGPNLSVSNINRAEYFTARRTGVII
jgi:hypothetical protein